MTTAIAVHRIEEQIRAKRADQLRVSEFISARMMEQMGEPQVQQVVAHRLARIMAERLMEKAEFRGIPSVSMEPGQHHHLEGDRLEANVVVVHPALWAEITALLRSLR